MVAPPLSAAPQRKLTTPASLRVTSGGSGGPAWEHSACKGRYAKAGGRGADLPTWECRGDDRFGRSRRRIRGRTDSEDAESVRHTGLQPFNLERGARGGHRAARQCEVFVASWTAPGLEWEEREAVFARARHDVSLSAGRRRPGHEQPGPGASYGKIKGNSIRLRHEHARSLLLVFQEEFICES